MLFMFRIKLKYSLILHLLPKRQGDNGDDSNNEAGEGHHAMATDSG